MTAPTSRLLNLLSLLQARPDWPGPVLAERLGVSHRTVRRDVDRLRELGYNVKSTKGPDGGYRLGAGTDLPPLLFDDDQALALSLALQTVAVSGSGLEEAALRALTTIRQVLPSRVRHRLDGLEITAVPGRPGDAPLRPISPETLLEISAAIRAHQTLRFDYISRQAGPEPVRHQVEPHHLVFSGGRWYLLAWDPNDDDWRIYRVDRLTPRTPHGKRFTPREVPGGNVTDYMSARFKGSVHANQWPCTGTVILHMPARDVLPFAGDGIVEDLTDGRCSLQAGSWSWVALAASFNRFDAAMEVVEPLELIEAFLTLAHRNSAAAARLSAQAGPTSEGPDPVT